MCTTILSPLFCCSGFNSNFKDIRKALDCVYQMICVQWIEMNVTKMTDDQDIHMYVYIRRKWNIFFSGRMEQKKKEKHVNLSKWMSLWWSFSSPPSLCELISCVSAWINKLCVRLRIENDNNVAIIMCTINGEKRNSSIICE